MTSALADSPSYYDEADGPSYYDICFGWWSKYITRNTQRLSLCVDPYQTDSTKGISALIGLDNRQSLNWRETVLRHELSHLEIMALFFLRKGIIQTCIRSHPVELDVWFLVGPFHSSCVWTAKALARLCRCAGSPEPWLVACVIMSWLNWRQLLHVLAYNVTNAVEE